MNEFEKKKCMDLTKKMLLKDLCRPFREKVDPERDGAPDYLEIIKEPMDLSTVRNKIKANEYKTIDEWSDDIRLIFSNAKKYNDESTLVNLIAREVEQWFEKKIEKLPKTSDEEWKMQITKTLKNMDRLINIIPKSLQQAISQPTFNDNTLSKKCSELTKKMLQLKDLCRPFRKRVDPEEDGAPDYYEIIKEPMDIGTIYSNSYHSIKEWEKDVRLVWSNAKLYNNEGTLIHIVARELEVWFEKKVQNIPINREEAWLKQFKKALNNLIKLIDTPPSSILQLSRQNLGDVDKKDSDEI